MWWFATRLNKSKQINRSEKLKPICNLVKPHDNCTIYGFCSKDEQKVLSYLMNLMLFDIFSTFRLFHLDNSRIFWIWFSKFSIQERMKFSGQSFSFNVPQTKENSKNVENKNKNFTPVSTTCHRWFIHSKRNTQTHTLTLLHWNMTHTHARTRSCIRRNRKPDN